MTLIKEVETTDQIRMRQDMENAPLGKKLLLINLGGVLVTGTLTTDTVKYYLEWQRLPKRALKKEKK